MTTTTRCPYCERPPTRPEAGFTATTIGWSPPARPRRQWPALKVTSVRHYTDSADMTPEEAATFGPLVTRLDAALRVTTDAERVHLGCTRDRVPHFHAWLYPRSASHPLRGTKFLAAPQQSTLAEIKRVAGALREGLA